MNYHNIVEDRNNYSCQFIVHNKIYDLQIREQFYSMKDFADDDTVKKNKSHIFNQPLFEKKFLKEHINAIENGVCIDHMIQKRTSTRLDCLRMEQTNKIKNTAKSISLKRQGEHSTNSANSIMQKTKTNILEGKMPSIKEAKYVKNNSFIWKCKKQQQEIRKMGNGKPSSSFYFKQNQKPFQFNFKMEIKKVDSSSQPKTSKKTSQSSEKLMKMMDATELISEQSCPENKQKQEDLRRKLMNQIHKEGERKIKSRYNMLKEKFQNSRISGGTIKKLRKKEDEGSVESKKIDHIKNILVDSSFCNEELVPLFSTGKTTVNRMGIGSIDLLASKTAEYFSVCYYNSQNEHFNCLYEKKSNIKVQIASITKVMTCLLVLNIAEFFQLQIKSQKGIVGEKASKMPGTSAQLNYSDILTIHELLHGLMLPSGNDAAVALADWGGKIIRKYCNLASKYLKIKDESFRGNCSSEKKSYQKLFISHMNKAAKALNLKSTHFSNTHGLMNEKSYSTANDVALLTWYAMKNDTFRSIVKKRQFSCQILNRTYSQSRKVTWVNTNKLLNIDGFIGVKTGVTPAAGPCLSSMFKINEKEQIIIVVLKVRSLEYRFKQSLQLLKDAVRLMQKRSHRKVIQQIDKKTLQKGNYEDDRQDINIMEDQKQRNSISSQSDAGEEF